MRLRKPSFNESLYFRNTSLLCLLRCRQGKRSRLCRVPGLGVLLSSANSKLYAREELQDVELKLEFMVLVGSNSGVKLNGHYEIQIRDS